MSVEEELGALEGLNIEALRAAWRSRLNEPVPPVRSGDLLRRRLAERLQEEAYGRDLDLEKRLARLVAAHGRGERLAPARPQFKPGTVLIKTYGGTTHRVEVLQDGFLWDGRRWKSLSEIARAITGVRWNGPRFFGLRDASALKGGAR